MPPNVTGLWMAWDYQRTVELALRLQPETREIVCISGTGVQEQRWNDEARKVLERFATRVRTRWLDKLPLEAVLDEVAKLPPDSVVLYIPMLRDGAGKSVSPFEVARSSLKLPECRSTVSPDPNLKKESLVELCLIFRRSAKRPPRSPSACSLESGRHCSRPRTRRPIHCSLTGVHSKNGMSLRAEFLRKPRCGIGTQSLWEQHPRLILATAAVIGLQSLLIAG